jgi:hypothetical protein
MISKDKWKVDKQISYPPLPQSQCGCKIQTLYSPRQSKHLHGRSIFEPRPSKATRIRRIPVCRPGGKSTPVSSDFDALSTSSLIPRSGRPLNTLVHEQLLTCADMTQTTPPPGILNVTNPHTKCFPNAGGSTPGSWEMSQKLFPGRCLPMPPAPDILDGSPWDGLKSFSNGQTYVNDSGSDQVWVSVVKRQSASLIAMHLGYPHSRVYAAHWWPAPREGRFANCLG